MIRRLLFLVSSLFLIFGLVSVCFAQTSDTVVLLVTVISDTTPPQITSVTPADGSAFYESDTIVISPTVNDTDPSPLEYQFSIDGIIKQAWSSLSSYNWITSSQDKGSHNIKVEVRDAGGQDTKQVGIYIFRKPIEPPPH